MFLDHVTLIVADVERSRRFFVDQLGLPEVERPEFDFEGAWFAVGPAQIHVTAASPEAGRPGGESASAERASRGAHFALRVEDFDAILHQLHEARLKPVAGPRQRPDGLRQVYVADPDGHVIELCGE